MGIYIVARSGGVVQQYSTPSACYLPRVMDHYFKEQINGSWNWMDVPGHDYLWLNMFFCNFEQLLSKLSFLVYIKVRYAVPCQLYIWESVYSYLYKTSDPLRN